MYLNTYARLVSGQFSIDFIILSILVTLTLLSIELTIREYYARHTTGLFVKIPPEFQKSFRRQLFVAVVASVAVFVFLPIDGTSVVSLCFVAAITSTLRIFGLFKRH